ncbi:hypothetical protein ACLOJK_002189 [Asimina triloba]
MGRTENPSPTFFSTGDPCLDFFFHVVPNTRPNTLIDLLRQAWAHNPLTALKLICNLRGVRGTGKSDKEGFYTAALWLHQNHPKTLALNLSSFADFGYLKDLPEILFRLLAGADFRKKMKEERETKRSWRSGSRHRVGHFGLKKLLKKVESREERIAAESERVKIEKEKARKLRTAKIIEMARRVVDRHDRDADYRCLHDRGADFFAELLLRDMEAMKSGNLNKISLAAKWCPSLDSSFDHSTLLCESIARRVFPRESEAIYGAIEEQHYAYRVRDRLRKEVLVPLRRILQLPEVYMSANRWAELPYDRVASVAMKNYKKLFRKHDAERFAAYLNDVRQGKATIAAGALLPHEILALRTDYGKLESGADEVAELQWKRMVEDLSKKGNLSNCLAVCDVSGSMAGTPMEVCVALGLLISELSEEPWKGNVITFSRNPQLQQVRGETLEEKAEFVRNMEWGTNTDLQKAFDRILEVAVAGGLKAKEMVRRVFVFSDMEFDVASAVPWETDYEAIVRKYGEKGYPVPELVFWNLRDSRATPVTGRKEGVALVSGFSKNLITLFFERNGVVSPEAVMEAAISGLEYQKLVVYDDADAENNVNHANPDSSSCYSILFQLLLLLFLFLVWPFFY